MISAKEGTFDSLMFNPDGRTVGHPLVRDADVQPRSIPVGSFPAGSFHYHALERSNNA